MNILMQEKLKGLFLELSTLLVHNPQGDQKFAHLDCSSLVVLKILHLLLDDEALIKHVAGSLAMVFNPGESLTRRDVKLDLLEAFMHIEQDLDEDQRGFVALYDEVFDQVSIQNDPHVLLSFIACEQPLLAEHFSYLVHAFLVYRELEGQISRAPAHVAPCIFVVGMKDLLAHHQKESGLLISDWLLCRVRNELLQGLYEKARRPTLAWAQTREDHFMVAVCLLVARMGWGKVCEIEDVHQALLNFGLGNRSLGVVALDL